MSVIEVGLSEALLVASTFIVVKHQRYNRTQANAHNDLKKELC